MSISAGFTVEEIRAFVLDYQLQPHGSKAAWLARQGVSAHQLKRWVQAVYGGDLDRGLVPRDASGMTLPPDQRKSIARERAAERAAHEAEVARLNARVSELEQTNEALGKAIGLLHSMSEQEPDTARTTTDPSDSSKPRTTSSES